MKKIRIRVLQIRIGRTENKDLKKKMGFDEPQVNDGDDGGAKSLSTSNVSCSICLELVTDNGDRSWAKLQCGHEFHLDCIGSAFNIKGAMQCPNCRKIEKGQWLFATGCRLFTDVSFEDWPHDEDLYDLSYSEMSFGVQWCPITPFPRLPSSFEEGEFPSTAYHDLLGQHAVFAEHAVPSSTHPCPYVAYYGPIHSSSSSPVGSMSDGSNYSGHWGGPSGSSELPTSFSFAPMDPHYQSWEHHSLPFSATASRLVGPDQSSIQSMTQRSSRASSNLAREGSFIHPFILSHSLGARVAGSPTSSMIPPYPGSAARARDRAQALQAYFQPPNTSPPMRVASSRRSNGHRGPPQVGPPPSSSDQAGGFYVFPSGTSSRNFPEVESPINSRFYSWERDHPANFPPVERDSSWGGWSGSGSFRQRH